MEGYTIDRTLLTEKELQAVMEGLQSLDSVTYTRDYKNLMDKLSLKKVIHETQEHVSIDLSSYYKGSLAPKLEQIRKAIEERRVISFQYYNRKGERMRRAEPYLLVYRWNAWYVWGYCLDRLAMRMFKLNRLWDLRLCEQIRGERQIPPYDDKETGFFKEQVILEALFEAEAKWRLIEEYGPEYFEEQPDGRLYFKMGFDSEEYLLSWILSFGSQAEVQKPLHIRKLLYNIAEELLKKYRES